MIHGWTPVRFILQREGPEALFAIISAEIQDPRLKHECDFRKALTCAITDWMENHEDGQTAWKQSCRDFNVGDLALWENDPVLMKKMSDRGIRRLEVETISGDEACDHWVFDTVLADDEVLAKEE